MCDTSSSRSITSTVYGVFPKFSLKKAHKYYDQVQGPMFVTQGTQGFENRV